MIRDLGRPRPRRWWRIVDWKHWSVWVWPVALVLLGIFAAVVATTPR